MPSKALVALPKPLIAAALLDEALKEGYLFTQDRWEGSEHKKNAFAVRNYFKQLGYDSAVHIGEDSSWAKGKNVKYPYFKVWIGHPKEPTLYMWWTPSAATWGVPVDLSTVTWFEFQDAK